MYPIHAALFSAALLVLSTPAPALVAATPAEPEAPKPVPVAPAAGTCTPAGFTIVKTAEGYLLSGAIETPTPGYSYTYENGTLTLAGPPEGTAQIQVISSLAIEVSLPASAGDGVSVPVAKKFNWGPDNISCELNQDKETQP
ncbi:MAG TPA: hypothetical protein VEF76_01405 [Patescibacteria group bacterium]|nr:hypothetical protein [Patescibacteria group bacterium]